MLRPRTLAALARRARARDPRDRRHRADVPVGAAATCTRPGSTSPSSATRAPSSPSRRAAASCCTSRSRSSSRSEAIAAVEEAGFGLNCYVDDELYVAEVTEWARAYADFQNLRSHAVGDLLGWLDRAADEARRRRRPGRARRAPGRSCRSASAAGSTSRSRCRTSSSSRSPDVSKGSGLDVPRGPARVHGRADGRVRRRRERPSSCSTGPATRVASSNAHAVAVRARRPRLPAAEDGGRRAR